MLRPDASRSYTAERRYSGTESAVARLGRPPRVPPAPPDLARMTARQPADRPGCRGPAGAARCRRRLSVRPRRPRARRPVRLVRLSRLSTLRRSRRKWLPRRVAGPRRRIRRSRPERGVPLSLAGTSPVVLDRGMDVAHSYAQKPGVGNAVEVDSHDADGEQRCDGAADVDDIGVTGQLENGADGRHRLHAVGIA